MDLSKSFCPLFLIFASSDVPPSPSQKWRAFLQLFSHKREKLIPPKERNVFFTYCIRCGSVDPVCHPKTHAPFPFGHRSEGDVLQGHQGEQGDVAVLQSAVQANLIFRVGMSRVSLGLGLPQQGHHDRNFEGLHFKYFLIQCFPKIQFKFISPLQKGEQVQLFENNKLWFIAQNRSE